MQRLSSARSEFEARFPDVAARQESPTAGMLHSFTEGKFDDIYQTQQMASDFAGKLDLLDKNLMSEYCERVDGKRIVKSNR